MKQSTNDYRNKSDSYLMNLYHRHKIVLSKGDGVYLYDTDDKKYLDFAQELEYMP